MLSIPCMVVNKHPNFIFLYGSTKPRLGLEVGTYVQIQLIYLMYIYIWSIVFSFK